jgi:hypothetical protein
MSARKYIRDKEITEEEFTMREFPSNSTTASISAQISDFVNNDKYTISVFKEAHKGARKFKRTEFNLKTGFKLGLVSGFFEIGWKKEPRKRKEQVLLNKRIIKSPRKSKKSKL